MVGYNQSDILKRPATVGHTVTMPAACEGPSRVPYPAAFERAKKFLKDILYNLWKAKDEFVVQLGPRVALEKLALHQLPMYARREGPFSSPPSSDTLSWWRALSESADADVLAVC